MKTYIIVAAISAVVSVTVWEAMHIITGADAPQKETARQELIWRKHI